MITFDSGVIKKQLDEWFNFHSTEIKSERTEMLKKKHFIDVDSELQDKYYNFWIQDYIDEYNAQKKILEEKIGSIEWTIKEETTKIKNEKDTFMSENQSDLLKVQDIIDILSIEKDKLNSIQNNIQDFRKSIESLRQAMDWWKIAIDTLKKQYKDAFLKIENTLEEFKLFFDKQVLEKKNELWWEVQKQFHEFMGELISDVQKKLELYKEEQIWLINEYCSSPRSKEYIQRLAILAWNIEKTQKNIKKENDTLFWIKKASMGTDFWLIILLLFICFIDFVFFRKIINDIFEISWGDPTQLWVVWWNMLTIMIPICVVVFYAFSRKMISHIDHKMAGYFTKYWVIILVILLIVFSVITFWKDEEGFMYWDFAWKNWTDITWYMLELVIRCLLLPVLVVWDYIISQINWSVIVKIVPMFFIPFKIFLLVIVKSYQFIHYLFVENLFFKWHESILNKHSSINRNIDKVFTPTAKLVIDFSSIHNWVTAPWLISDSLEFNQNSFDWVMKNLDLLNERVKQSSDFIDRQLTSSEGLKSLQSNDVDIKLKQIDINGRQRIYSTLRDKDHCISSLEAEQKKIDELKWIFRETILNNYNKYILSPNFILSQNS